MSILKKFSLSQFHNINYGDSCYIFGDGGSTKNYDLKHFQNLPSICCGKMFLRKNFNYLNTLYYTIPEPRLFWPNFFPIIQRLKDNKEVGKLLKEKILELDNINFFLNATNFGFISGKNINFIHRSISKIELPNKLDPFAGSFKTVLSLAYHFGFKKVYLIGFDSFTKSSFSDLRWYEYGKIKGVFNRSIIENRMIDFYKEKMDITSIGLTDKDSINFKSISYKEFTGESPNYLENYELTTNKNLKILSTQPYHKMQ
jgi:hypothetical protein